MKAFCLGGLLCLALNASALTYTYSGTVGSSTARFIGETDTFIDVGDAFTVTLSVNPNNSPGFPKVSFNLTVGGYFFQTYPFEYSGSYFGTDDHFFASSLQEIWGTGVFRGAGQINVTENGGTISLGLSGYQNNIMGSLSVSFSSTAPVAPSSQPVPEAASTLGLLALGFASIVGLRFHRVS